MRYKYTFCQNEVVGGEPLYPLKQPVATLHCIEAKLARPPTDHCKQEETLFMTLKYFAKFIARVKTI